MSDSAPPPTEDLRALQTIWGALSGGVALATLTLGGLTLAGRGGSATAYAETLFFANAFISLAAIVVAFAVQRRMVMQLPDEASRVEVVADARRAGVLSLASLEASALVACVTSLLTGQLVNLLFVAPFFGFAIGFFPTAGRIDALRAVTMRAE